VLDLYSVKPVDVEGLPAAAEATAGRIVTVEDHWPEGGVGEAVLSAFADADERPVSPQAQVRGGLLRKYRLRTEGSNLTG
jgi:transketolase